MAEESYQHVVLNLSDIKVDADPEVLADMMERLIFDEEFRQAFERDPISHLNASGIRVPEELRGRITRENIDATLNSLIEGGDPQAIIVAVGVRVGTRPGTRPGVNVGVRVFTQTSTFGRPSPLPPFAAPRQTLPPT